MSSSVGHLKFWGEKKKKLGGITTQFAVFSWRWRLLRWSILQSDQTPVRIKYFFTRSLLIEPLHHYISQENACKKFLLTAGIQCVKDSEQISVQKNSTTHLILQQLTHSALRKGICVKSKTEQHLSRITNAAQSFSCWGILTGPNLHHNNFRQILKKRLKQGKEQSASKCTRLSEDVCDLWVRKGHKSFYCFGIF